MVRIQDKPQIDVITFEFVQLICPSLLHETTALSKIGFKTIYFVNITSGHIASLFRVVAFTYKHSTQCKRNAKRKTPQCGPETGLFTLIKRHACEWDRYSYVSHLFLYVTLFTSLLVCVCNSIYDSSLGKEVYLKFLDFDKIMLIKITILSLLKYFN